jgi:hypothetical protein
LWAQATVFSRCLNDNRNRAFHSSFFLKGITYICSQVSRREKEAACQTIKQAPKNTTTADDPPTRSLQNKLLRTSGTPTTYTIYSLLLVTQAWRKGMNGTADLTFQSRSLIVKLDQSTLVQEHPTARPATLAYLTKLPIQRIQDLWSTWLLG